MQQMMLDTKKQISKSGAAAYGEVEPSESSNAKLGEVPRGETVAAKDNGSAAAHSCQIKQ